MSDIRKTQRGWQAYISGLRNAYAKGVAYALDPFMTESSNPYKMWEYRRAWLDGFRAERERVDE